MARVKRGVTAHAKHKKVLKAAKGYYGRRKNTIRIAKQAVEKAQPIRLPRPQAKQAHVPRALDQRLNAAVRPFGLNYSRFIDGLAQGRHPGRPQGAVGTRDPRAGGVRGDRDQGQGRARLNLEWSHFLRRTGIHFAGKCSGPRRRALAGGDEHARSQSRTSARPLVRGARRQRAAARPHGREDAARRAGAVRPHQRGRVFALRDICAHRGIPLRYGSSTARP